MVDMCTREYLLSQDDICRLCFSKDARICLLEDSLKASRKLYFKIKEILAMELWLESYPKPNKVCETCLAKINDFYEFKQNCIDSQLKLHKVLEKSTLEKAENSTLENDLQIKKEKDDKIDEIKNVDKIPVLNESDSLIKSENVNDTLEFNTEIKIEICPEIPSHKECGHTNNIKVEICSSPINDFNNPHDKTVAEEHSEESSSKLTFELPPKSKYFCELCYLDLENEQKFHDHNSIHGIQQDGTFKCFGCPQTFTETQDRLCHEVNTCESLKDGYICHLCDTSLPLRNMYEEHIKTHKMTKNKNTDSKPCQKTVNKKIMLKRKLKNSISKRDVLKCEKCNKAFKNSSELLNHTATHINPEEKLCEKCGQVILRRLWESHRQTHIRRERTTPLAKRFNCSRCDYKTSWRNDLNVHMRKHTGERPYPCDMCSLRCVTISNLVAHRRRHTEPLKYQCAVCDKKYGSKSSLRTHIETVHENSVSRDHQCTHCDAAYLRAWGLKQHMLAKHGVDYKKVGKPGRPAHTATGAVAPDANSKEK